MPSLLPLLTLALLLAGPAVGFAAGSEEGRANLAQVFPGWPAWEAACGRLEADVEAFSRLREKPIQTPGDLLRVLEAREVVHRGARRVEGYVSLRLDLDAGDAEARERRQRVQRILEDWESRASTWYVPRVVALGRERVSGWLDESPRLAIYRFFLERMFRQQEHRLPEAEERLLALADVFDQQTRGLHQALSVVEAPQVTVRLGDGGDLAVTAAGARSLPWQMRDAADRRRVRQAWLEALGQRSGTYAALLDGVVRRERFAATARGHADALDAALYEDAIPRSAVEMLLAVARERGGSLREVHQAVAMVHEMLLVRRLVEEEGVDRAAVVDLAIQNFLRSFYRPAIDADFEIRLHTGEVARTGEHLGELYLECLRSYYGDTVRLEPWDGHGWMEVPHFFTSPLYMVRYGLAYAAGSALVRELTAADLLAREHARQSYLDLLRAGGSDFPTALLARAGADLSQPSTIRAVTDRLDELVSEIAHPPSSPARR